MPLSRPHLELLRLMQGRFRKKEDLLTHDDRDAAIAAVTHLIITPADHVEHFQNVWEMFEGEPAIEQPWNIPEEHSGGILPPRALEAAVAGPGVWTLEELAFLLLCDAQCGAFANLVRDLNAAWWLDALPGGLPAGDDGTADLTEADLAELLAADPSLPPGDDPPTVIAKTDTNDTNP